jgi:hypothetical protein
MRQVRWDNDRRTGWLRLAGATAVIAGMWIVVLPLIGRQAVVRDYIERNESLGIDPSAKFYTELPGMHAIREKVEGVRRRDAAAFWYVQ